MSSTINKAIKYSVIGGIAVYFIGSFAGAADTARFTANSVHGTGWGVGVLYGSAPEAGVGFHEGMNAAKVAANP